MGNGFLRRAIEYLKDTGETSDQRAERRQAEAAYREEQRARAPYQEGREQHPEHEGKMPARDWKRLATWPLLGFSLGLIISQRPHGADTMTDFAIASIIMAAFWAIIFSVAAFIATFVLGPPTRITFPKRPLLFSAIMAVAFWLKLGGGVLHLLVAIYPISMIWPKKSWIGK